MDEISHQDKMAVVELLANEAEAVDSKRYFPDLIAQANIPKQFKSQVIDAFAGTPKSNALKFFAWAIQKSINPEDPRYTTLASLLEPLLLDYGLDKASIIAALIYKYRLIREDELRNRLAKRYQIPNVISAENVESNTGPQFNWRGSEEPLELQSLLRADPVDLSVGFLKQGIECASAVCRIEVSGSGPRGTGFLIASNLVLTSYHVLGDTADVVKESAAKTKLRFGALTNWTADEDEGQLVDLDRNEPVLYGSEITAHDFVLLRASSSINDCKGLSHVKLQPLLPKLNSGLSILHHPGGKPMKLTVSTNGVASVLDADGRVQYVSRTTGGSSGAPCFDDEWSVVAIHHAARSKVWGVAGEGILIAAIQNNLHKYLS